MRAAWAAGSLMTLALDLSWLGVLAPGLYRREVGHLMAARANFGAAGLFYLLYGWGLWHFAVRGALGAGLGTALRQGALLGLLVYGTYDLTNLAVLKGWTPLIAAVDVAWGIFLSAAAAGAAYQAASWGH